MQIFRHIPKWQMLRPNRMLRVQQHHLHYPRQEIRTITHLIPAHIKTAVKIVNAVAETSNVGVGEAEMEVGVEVEEVEVETAEKSKVARWVGGSGGKSCKYPQLTIH